MTWCGSSGSTHQPNRDIQSLQVLPKQPRLFHLFQPVTKQPVIVWKTQFSENRNSSTWKERNRTYLDKFTWKGSLESNSLHMAQANCGSKKASCWPPWALVNYRRFQGLPVLQHFLGNTPGSCGQLLVLRARTYLAKQRTSLSSFFIPVVTRIAGKSTGTRSSSAATAKMHLGVSIPSLNSTSKAKCGSSST